MKIERVCCLLILDMAVLGPGVASAATPPYTSSWTDKAGAAVEKYWRDAGNWSVTAGDPAPASPLPGENSRARFPESAHICLTNGDGVTIADMRFLANQQGKTGILELREGSTLALVGKGYDSYVGSDVSIDYNGLNLNNLIDVNGGTLVSVNGGTYFRAG